MVNQSVGHWELTSFQQELWLAHLALPGAHPGISNGGIFTIKGCPDREVIYEALKNLKACFPLSSATLKPTEGRFPVFITGVYPKPEMEFRDFREEPDPEAAARQWLVRFKEKPFSPLGGNLFRYALLYLSDESSWFVSQCFHLAGDGFFTISQAHLLMSWYDALKNKKTFELHPAPPWQKDVDADRKYMQSAASKSDGEAWASYLKNLPPEPVFSPRIRATRQSEQPEGQKRGITAHCEQQLFSAATERVRKLSRAHRMHPSHIFIALHLVVLSRLYDASHLSIQIPLRFGEGRDLGKIQGHRIQFAPLIANIDKQTSFTSLITELRTTLKRISKLRLTPFQKALRTLAPGQDMSHIWDTNINFIPYISTKESKSILKLCGNISSRHEPVILGVYLIEQADKNIIASIDYSTDYFKEHEIRQYIRRMEATAAEWLENPDALIMEKDALLDDEIAMLEGFQSGPVSAPDNGTIAFCFDKIAAKHKDLPAVKSQTDGQVQTYDQLRERSNAIGTWLVNRGLEPGKVVAVFTDRHPNLPAIILGIMKAGGVYLPVDPNYPQERIRHMLDDSGAKLILSTEAEQQQTESTPLPIPDSLPSAEPEKLPGLSINPAAPAYLIYTSGSTGLPKGVLVSHRGFVNMAHQQIEAFGQSCHDRVLQFASPSFDAALAETFSALLCGGCLFPVPRVLIDDPPELKAYIEEEGISVVTFPPSYLRLFNKTRFKGLRVLITAGEPPIAEDARHYGRQLNYFNAYGPTEASVCATIFAFDPDAELAPETIGKPIGNTRAYVVDSRGRRKVPNQPGELCLGGMGLAIEYLGKSRLTNERFGASPHLEEERLYRTGDLAAWSDSGNLLLLGRSDDQLKIRGHRVEPGEVNRALESLPSIHQAACIGFCQPGGIKSLHAFLISEKGAEYSCPFDSEEIIDRLGQMLPAHMIPSRFHLLDAMPIAPTGKVDKKALENMAKKAMESSARATSQGQNLSAAEMEIREIFTQILGNPPPDTHADFFTLGGDSLLAIELTRRLFDTYGCRITIRELMKQASIRSLARMVEMHQTSDLRKSCGMPETVYEKIHLNYGQQGIRAQEMALGASAGYNMPFALDIYADEAEVSRFCTCLEQAIAAQPGLQCHLLSVENEADEAVFKLADKPVFPMEKMDLRQIATPEKIAAQWFDTATHAPFDLTTPPLFRVCLAQLDNNRWQLLLVFHHLIADGHSIALLLHSCADSMAGSSPVPISPGVLEEFAEAEQNYLHCQKEGKKDLKFWKNLLTPAPPRLNLCPMANRPAIKSRDGELLRRDFSPRMAALLTTLSRKSGATLQGCFTGLVLEFLQKRTGQDDVAVSVPVGLRDTPALEQTAGYFVNLMIVRAVRANHAQSQPAIIEQIRQHWQNFRSSLAHSRYPFGLLVDALDTPDQEKDPSRWPITDVIVTHIDSSSMLPPADKIPGMKLQCLELPFRGAKADYTFILHTRQDGQMGLILEYDIHVATAVQAEDIADDFLGYLEKTAEKVFGAKPVSGDGELSFSCKKEELQNARKEELLCRGWKKILAVKMVPGSPQNRQRHFLLDGGDSIKAIQLAGFLKRNGAGDITPAQIFQTPNFARLKELIRLSAEQPATPLAPTPAFQDGEEIPLLPLQTQLFRRQAEDWHHFHMIYPMQLTGDVDISRIPDALKALAEIHEAFHLSFEAPGKAIFHSKPADPVFAILKTDKTEPIALGAKKLFGELNPAAGRCFGAVLIESGKEYYLVLGGHHLVLDAVSLDILCHELLCFCKNGQFETLPAAGIAAWAKAVLRKDCQLATPSQIEYWQKVCSTPGSLLKGLMQEGDDRPSLRQSGRKSICQTLPPGTFRLSANPRRDLLAALGSALYKMGQESPVFITLEGHGREMIKNAPNISQAVGWFTAAFPVVLSPLANPMAQAAALEEIFQALPHNGLGYGFCRQAVSDSSLDYNSQITFNYLGGFISGQKSREYTLLPKFTSPAVLPELLPENYHFDSPLDIRGCILPGGSLELVLEFSPACMDADWVQGVSQLWADTLQQAAQLPVGAEPATLALLSKRAGCIPEEIEEIHPPQINQEGMLFQSLLESEKKSENRAGGSYIQQINFMFEGELDIPCFEKAWKLVLNRHKALRSRYVFDEDGNWHCLTLKQGRIPWQVDDLQAASSDKQAALRQDLLKSVRQQGFDLAFGPLLRVNLLILGKNSHEVSLCFHHILMDGWCIGILLGEVLNIYGAISRKQEIEPASLLSPAPDPANFQLFLENFAPQPSQKYWKKVLEGFSSPTLLATPLSAPDRPFAGELEWCLDSAATKSLYTHAANAGVSLAALIQAVWAILAGKISRTAQASQTDTCRDVVFGIISSGRTSRVEEMEKMVGLFIQTLPVRVRWQDDTPVIELAKTIGEESLKRTEHEYYPLADIQRDISLSPLFDHIVVFETYPLDVLQRKKNDALALTSITGWEKHPYALSLSVILGECLTLRLTSGALPVSASLVKHIKHSLETVLPSLGEQPHLCCKEVAAMMKPQKAVTPDKSCEGDGENLCTRFADTARQFCNAPALISEEGTPWSYDKLNQISDSIAAGITAGLNHTEETVAFCLPRTPMAVAVMLGILKSGRAYLPIDAKNPLRRNGQILEIAGCRTLILAAGNEHRKELEQYADCLLVEELAEQQRETPGRQVDFSGIKPAAPAYIMFTSGSTGEPKGVVVPHRAVMNLVTKSDFWQIFPGERMLQTGPLGFDASNLEIWGPLLNGGTTCFIHDHDLLTPARLQKIIIRERITLMWLTASLCNLLADETPEMFRPLRRLFVGGEALSCVHIQRIMTACPDLELINGYGPTENTTFTTTHRVTLSDIEQGNIPIGKPITNTRVYILDDNDRPVPNGEWGQICAAGANLSLGYAGRDDLTRRVFVDIAAPVGERVYKTGDIGRQREDGVIEYRGRKDSQVKVRGYRIELSEIESTLQKLSWLKNAAVLAPQTGEYRSLVAWVQPDSGQRSEQIPEKSGIEALVKKHLASLLPAYMVPDTVNTIDHFPVTPNGKLDRKKLEQEFLQGETAAESDLSADKNEQSVELSAIQTRVAEVFSDVLERKISEADADFFQMGGQSLRAMRMILRLNQLYNVELDVGQVMKQGKVKDIAAMIYTLAQSGAAAPIPVVDNAKNFPLSRGQKRLWFLQCLAPENPVYGVPFVRIVHGNLDINALKRAITAVETKHDALRLRLPASFSGTEPTQKIAPPGQVVLEYKDFSMKSDPGQSIDREVAKVLGTAFTFGYDQPLFRALVFKKSDTEHLLLLYFHHIICDGWSGNILLGELFCVYEGDKKNCQPNQIRYVDYAVWQKNFLESAKGKQLVDRCVRRLTDRFPNLGDDGNFPLVNLPISGKRPQLPSHKGAVLRIQWPDKRQQALSELAASCQTTLFGVLLALVTIFLHRHDGGEDIVVGVPAAGRNHWQLENLVGFFVNTLVICTKISPQMPFTTLLQQVKSELDQALAEQACPFELLVEGLNLQRNPSRNPLFDIFVSFEDKEWETFAPPAGLQLENYPIPHNHSKFDLSFYFRRTNDGLFLEMEYSTELFSPADIASFGERLGVLADGACSHPKNPVSQLPLLPEAEREILLYDYNDTYFDIDFDQTIDALFTRQVIKNLGAAALRNAAGELLHFGELNRQVEWLALHLAACGVKKGTPVCLCFERSFELIISLFAIMRAGGVYVPVVPGLPPERIRLMSEDLPGCMALCRKKEAALFTGINIPVIPLPDCINQRPTDKVPPITPSSAKPLDPFATAYVIFTSGSTGRPKGVSIAHRSVVNRIQWMQSCFPLDETDVILQKTPISFDVSIWELFWWSWTGASLALLEPGGEKDPQTIVRAVKRHRVTVMHFVPSMLRIFLEYLQKHPELIAELTSLKYVFASGEALTPELAGLFNTLLYPANGTRLENLYGPTEATVDVTWHSCSPGKIQDTVSIGKPIANTRLYILDKHLEPTPAGVAGEIYLSGIQVAQGYVNRPELNEQCFLDDPFVPANRMYRTGDRGRWLPCGEVEYLGRKDNQVKIRGFRIELGEVEAALEGIPNVSQTIVRTGTLGGEPCLEAFLLCSADAPLSLETVRKIAGQRLPDYMIPALFYRLEQMPLSINGKADRKNLKGRPLVSRFAEKPAATPPPSDAFREQVLEQLRNIWKHVLPEAGAIHDEQPFFETGGTSFLAVRLHELLEEKWPGHFTIANLFVYTSIKKQADKICRGNSAGKTWQTAPDNRTITGDAERTRETKPEKEPIAIIGMALRLADYETEETFWADVMGQVDYTGSMPEGRISELIAAMKILGREIAAEDLGKAAYLSDISGFDCRRFGMAPADAALMDPQQRLFLETLLRALEDGGYGGDATCGQAIGVFAGASPSRTFGEMAAGAFPDRAEQAFILNLPSAMVTRIGYIKDWKGPAAVVDTACSSSLKAVQDACQSLINGECDMALAGGANIMLAPVKNQKAFTIQSTDGKTRPFDKNASGVGAGEGAVVFLLKPLSRALADNDAIRAVIRGGYINQDGRSSGMAAPNPLAQAEVIYKAAQNAGVDLFSLDFFEAHGTATRMGDPIEIEGINRAFALAEAADNDKTAKGAEAKAAVTSIKGHFGHLDAAAGALGMARAVLSLECGVVPRQIHFTEPNPDIDFTDARVFIPEKPVHLEAENRPWRCGVSAFGLSGINVHLILEQAPLQRWEKKEQDAGKIYPICLSASSAAALCQYVELMLDRLCVNLAWPLSAIAGTLAAGRKHLPFRLGIAAESREQLVEKLLAWRLEFDARTTMQPVRKSAETVLLGGFDDRESARQTVQLFLQGATPNWPQSEALIRVHLPAVPLEKMVCWPDFTKANTAISTAGTRFAEKKIRTEKGWLFPVPIHDTQFWPVSQHRLHHRPTLVGMAAVSLFFDAFYSVANPGSLPVQIENLSWLAPLLAEKTLPDSVVVTIRPIEQGVTAVLGGCDTQENRKDFATATLRKQETGARPPKALNLEQALADVSVHNTANAAFGQESIVEVSPRWNCRKKLWSSADGERIIALLELPADFHRELEQFSLHPAMMDVAASLGLELPGMVPAGFGRLTKFASLPARVFAQATKKKQAPGMLTFDCIIWDASSLACIVTIEDLAFVRARAPEALIYTPKWVQIEDEKPGGNQDKPSCTLMIIAESQDRLPLMEKLVKEAESKKIAVEAFPLPGEKEEQEALATQITAREIADILWLSPSFGGESWTLPSFIKTLCKQGFKRPVRFAVAGAGALQVLNTDNGDNKPPVDAALGLGIALCINREEPQLICRYIELDISTPPGSLLQEVMTTAGDSVSPLFIDAKGHRHRRKLLAAKTPKQTAPPIADDGCVVFTGGLGGMALTLALGAKELGTTSVALLHRGAFTDDDPKSFRRMQLKKLKEKGISVKLFSCDITHRESLAQTLTQVREELGAIRGIIHTAGVAGDGFLLNKEQAAFEAVLAPKKKGLLHLHELTIDDPLDFFVLASSRTALTGAPGQSDYTAANAWMDGFAHWRHSRGLTALSINWNTWAKVGMAARNHISALPDGSPMPALMPEQALPVLLKALACGQPQVVVAMPGENLDMPPVTDSTPEEQVRKNSLTDDTLPIEERIMLIIAQTLGYRETLSPDDDFYALGGDSITGMQLINRINEELALHAGLTDLFAHSKLNDFIAAITKTIEKTPGKPDYKAPDNLASYPVSREQQAVLQMTALSAPNTGYNLPNFLQLPDTARCKDFAEAFKALIYRHEILRTLFVDFDGKSPAMQILPPESSAEEFMLESMEIESITAAASRLIRPFKPDNYPLFRAAWLKTGEHGQVLFFDIFHALADARTVEILLGELLALWQGISLEPLVYQFKDAAFYQNQSSDNSRARKYWLAQFPSGSTLPKLNLPGDHPRPAIHTFAGKTHHFAVPDEWIADIRAFVRHHGTTSHVLVLSLWALLIARLAKTKEPVIAVAADSRSGQQYQNVAGMFASLLPLQIGVDETGTVKKLLERTHTILGEALGNAAFPLSSLLTELKPPMDPGRTLLSEITFSYMNSASKRAVESNFRQDMEIKALERINVAGNACKADIAIFASDTGEHLSFALEYYADYFSQKRIRTMGEDFLQLLDAVIHNYGKDKPLFAYGLPQTATSDGDILSVFRQLFKDDTIEETDSFFDLGGHSLLGLQIINRINAARHLELSIRDLFENPTPAAMALKLAEMAADSTLANHPAEMVNLDTASLLKQLSCPDGCYPLSHAQQRLYILQHSEGGDTAYNMPFLFEFDTLLDIERFSAALEKVCQRHEVLRTSLKQTDTGIWQQIAPSVPSSPQIHHLAAGDRDKALELFADMAASPFELDCGPLLKTFVCRLGDQQDMLLLLMHHIIGDGWSMQIFFRDLVTFYEGKKLPSLQIQYKEYALWQQSQNFALHANYWKKQLDKAPGRIELPADGPGKPRTLPAGSCKKEISEELLERLNILARQKGVSLATLMFTLFASLLFRLTRQPDMVIGMGVAGREKRETEELMGFFINILPIRVRLDDDTSVWDLLDRVHKTFLEALERQSYPFDLLVREVVADRSQNVDPLVNVMFEYQRYQDLEGIIPEQDGPLKCRVLDLYDELKGKQGPAARHDLTFFVQDTPLGCMIRAEFDPGVLTRDTVSTWLEYFIMVLESVVKAENNLDAQ